MDECKPMYAGHPGGYGPPHAHHRRHCQCHDRSGLKQTLNPKPSTLNPNPEPETRNPYVGHLTPLYWAPDTPKMGT